MYPVCTADCKPSCAGISAAMGYAKKYGASGVRDNLRAASKECKRLRSKKQSAKRSHKRASRKTSHKRQPSKNR